MPNRVGNNPDRARAPLAERGVVVGPITWAIAFGRLRDGEEDLTRWSRAVNSHPPICATRSARHAAVPSDGFQPLSKKRIGSTRSAIYA